MNIYLKFILIKQDSCDDIKKVVVRFDFIDASPINLALEFDRKKRFSKLLCIFRMLVLLIHRTVQLLTN